MKNIVLLFVGLFFIGTSYGQEGFEGGMGQFRMASYGEVCKNLEKEIDLAKCSQDQINEFIAQLKTPAIVETKKLKVSTIINFGISENGKVENVKVKKSSGQKEIDDLCLAHVKTMANWSPEISDDMIVPSQNLNLTFKFKSTATDKK